MVLYRRNRLSGGTYFFTVTLRDRRSTVLTDHVDLLGEAMRRTAIHRPFRTDAIVVLPDHLHALWTLPEGDADYAGRWRSIKARFTRGLLARGQALQKGRRGEYKLWQSRFWEHTIHDDTDFRHHVDYIHFNPVKHGMVSHVADWPFSSFHRFVARGDIPADWAGTVDRTGEENFGEPV